MPLHFIKRKIQQSKNWVASLLLFDDPIDKAIDQAREDDNLLAALFDDQPGEDDMDQARAWSISAQLAAVPAGYLQQVPSEVAALIRAAKSLHPEMAEGATQRDAQGEACPALG